MITAEQKVNILCGGIYTALHQLGTHLDSAASQSAAEQHLLRTIYLTLRGALHAAGEPLPEDRVQAKEKSPVVNTAVKLPELRTVVTTQTEGVLDLRYAPRTPNYGGESDTTG